MEESPAEQYRRLMGKSGTHPVYGNKHIERDGVSYDSSAEYAYKGVLDLEVKAGIITGYDHHVKLPLLTINGELIGYYEADYLCYMPDGSQQIRDVKSVSTALFKWKARHVKAQYKNPIILIDSKTLKPKSR